MFKEIIIIIVILNSLEGVYKVTVMFLDSIMLGMLGKNVKIA